MNYETIFFFLCLCILSLIAVICYQRFSYHIGIRKGMEISLVLLIFHNFQDHCPNSSFYPLNPILSPGANS